MRTNLWENCIVGNREPYMLASDLLGRRIMFPVPSERELPVRIYEPEPPFDKKTPGRYSVPVYTDLVPGTLAAGLIRKATPHGRIAWSKSKRKPEVHCNDVDGLVRELQRLDARNVTRDRIFEGKQLNALAYIRPFPPGIPSEFMERYPDAAFVLDLIAVEFTL